MRVWFGHKRPAYIKASPRHFRFRIISIDVSFICLLQVRLDVPDCRLNWNSLIEFIFVRNSVSKLKKHFVYLFICGICDFVTLCEQLCNYQVWWSYKFIDLFFKHFKWEHNKCICETMRCETLFLSVQI